MHDFWKEGSHFFKRKEFSSLGVYLQTREWFSLSFVSVEQGGKSKWQNRLECFGLPQMVCVCVFLSGCVCWDNGIIEVLESQAPWCLACWTGVSKGTFDWIRWPPCPFQVWLLYNGASNMNLEAIKDGWITCCPLPQTSYGRHKKKSLVSVELQLQYCLWSCCMQFPQSRKSMFEYKIRVYWRGALQSVTSASLNLCRSIRY